MKYIYLSGPITGCEEDSEVIFSEAYLQVMAAGYMPINPHFICRNIPKGSAHAVYMLRCMRFLTLLADAVVMLPGWESSIGALAEATTANACGIPVYTSIDSFFEAIKSTKG